MLELSHRDLMRHTLLLCLGCSAQIALAAPPEGDQSNVIVTASRVAENSNDALWSSTVFTREDIEARQPASLQDLLASVAGVDITNNGGLGKFSSVLIRGAESEHTLLLIDGVRVASATAGSPPYELIPVEQIERIEIVRGPRSTLYGSDAIGGVIQIFTRKAPKSGLTFGAEAGAGSHDSRKLGGNFAARGERAWLSIGAEAFDTNGFNSCANAAGVVFAGCFVSEPDADGFRNNSGTIAAGYAFNDAWSAQLNSMIADGRTEFDGSIYVGNETQFSERVFAVSLDGALKGNWHTHIALGRDQDHQENFFHDNTGTLGVGNFDTDRDTASVQLDGKLGDVWRLVSGVDYQRDKVGSNTPYNVDSRDTTGVFGELHGAFDQWSALVGTRYEDNEQFGHHIVGNAALGHALPHGMRVSASWGTAFHAPTFNDLYYPGFSNPDLKPEESRSFEVSLGGNLAENHLDWSLNLFQTNIDQLIGFDSSFNVLNIDKSRIRGAELSGDWRNDAWLVRAQLTHLDPINRGNDNLLPRRSKESASLELRHSSPTLQLGGVLRFQGKRFDDLANSVRLGSYATVDVTATQHIGRAFEVQAKVANLLDHDYQSTAFYLQDGRNYNVTLRYRFDSKR